MSTALITEITGRKAQNLFFSSARFALRFHQNQKKICLLIEKGEWRLHAHPEKSLDHKNLIYIKNSFVKK